MKDWTLVLLWHVLQFPWHCLAGISTAGCRSGKDCPARLPPIVLVPGQAGSLLEADVDRQSAVNSLCVLQGTELLWFNKKYLAPLEVDCWAEAMRLRLDVNASKASGKELDEEPEGVHVRTRKFGDIHNSLFDYGAFHGGTGIWTGVIKQLERLGFDAKRDFFAAPYDWRRGPAYWKEHDWPKLKSHVEKLVEKAGKPAIFVTVSMGSPYFASFLHHAKGVDLAWKKNHVGVFVSMSGVFDGTPAAMGLAVWGNAKPLQDEPAAKYDLKVPFAARSMVKQLMSGWGGVVYAFPGQRYTKGDEAKKIVQLPPAFRADLSEAMLPSVLSQMSAELGELYKLAQAFPIHTHPGVKTLCFYGTESPTVLNYEYLATPTNMTTPSPTDVGKGILAAVGGAVKGGRPDVGEAMKAWDQANELATSFWESGTAEAPSRPPEGATPGNSAWVKSVAALLDRRRPDLIAVTPGDGLAPHESLSVCDGWTDAQGLPAADVVQLPGLSHGADLFDYRSLVKLRKAVADLAGINDTQVVTDDDNRVAGKDMHRPLGEFEQFVGPVVASWDCMTWVKVYRPAVLASGCNAQVILKDPHCDGGCHQALNGDPNFVRSRCPETCKKGSGSTSAESGDEDMSQPLAEFEKFVGPEVAAWSCEQWANVYRDVDATSHHCRAEVILKSSGCEGSCKDGFEKTPDLMRLRCPKTCHLSEERIDEASARSGDEDKVKNESAGGENQESESLRKDLQARVAELARGNDGKGNTGKALHSKQDNTKRHESTGQAEDHPIWLKPHVVSDSQQPKVKAHKKHSKDIDSSSSTTEKQMVMEWETLIVIVVIPLLILCGLAIFFCRKSNLPTHTEANSPLGEDGDFSDFEGQQEQMSLASNLLSAFRRLLHPRDTVSTREFAPPVALEPLAPCA